MSRHVASVRLLPARVGLIYYATCTCNWQGVNHPTIGNVLSKPNDDARARATRDADEHLRDLAPVDRGG